MATDPTVLAIPAYFASMEAERRYLRRRAERSGPSPADYERADTQASLTMGVLSLVVPLATGALVRHVVPGKGRFGTALVGTAVGAVIATTVADRIAGPEPADGAGEEQRLDPDPAPGAAPAVGLAGRRGTAADDAVPAGSAAPAARRAR